METKKQLADKMEAYLQAMTEADEFCGAVLVAQDGEVLLSGGYGLADREHDVPNTPQTKFRLGSITNLTLSQAQTHSPQSKVEVEARKVAK